MTKIVTLLGKSGVPEALDLMARDNATGLPRVSLENLFAESGVVESGDTVDACLEANLIEPFGARLGISSLGRRSLILLRALEGGDLEQLFRGLQRVTGVRAQYELVRQGMTGDFFESLVHRPDVSRLYFCSPWIHPGTREASILRHTVMQSQKRGRSIEVVVLTRPPETMPAGIEDGLRCFREVGAQIFLNKRLHSKLYIREPDANGGMTMAIVGSQNLTRSAHLELGIRINGDGLLVDKLIRYFWEVTNHSAELLQ